MVNLSMKKINFYLNQRLLYKKKSLLFFCSNWIPPRLFVINNDDSGVELLNKDQLNNYFRIKEMDKNCQQLIDDKVNGIGNAKSMAFLTKLLPWTHKKPIFINAYIPKNIDILPQTFKKMEEPEEKNFLLRNLLIFPEFDQENRESFKKDLEKYDLWKKNQVKEISEFGIIEKSEEDKDKEFSIQLKILDSRNKQYHEETYDERKMRLPDLLLNYEQKSAIKSPTVVAPGKKKVVAKKHQKTTSIDKPTSELLDVSKDSKFYKNIG